MEIELSIHDIDNKDIDIKQKILSAVKYQPDAISVYSSYIKYAQRIIKDSCLVSSVIDYPLGILDFEIRHLAIKQAINAGAHKIDIVMPSILVNNKKYDKIKKDIADNLKLCKDNNVELRYILEYRIFNHYTLTKICKILKEEGIETIYTSTGHMIDNLTDNTIACMYLAKKTKINTIVNGDIWRTDQIKTILDHSPYGIRFKNLHSLRLWHEQSE